MPFLESCFFSGGLFVNKSLGFLFWGGSACGEVAKVVFAVIEGGRQDFLFKKNVIFFPERKGGGGFSFTIKYLKHFVCLSL